MKRLCIAIAVLFSGTCAVPAFAQDNESNKPRNQVELFEVGPALCKAVAQLQRYSDIAKRELLKTTSDRNLKFRCGRYWVDVYSKLIAPDDREVGIWGVDLPVQGQFPSMPLQR